MSLISFPLVPILLFFGTLISHSSVFGGGHRSGI